MPGAAARIRHRYGAAVVLKGARSVLCAQEGLALNPFGTPAMAKGGSGDALTGVMAALLAGRAAGAYAMDDLFLMQAACACTGWRASGPRGDMASGACWPQTCARAWASIFGKKRRGETCSPAARLRRWVAPST